MQPFASAHGPLVTSPPGSCANRGETLTTFAIWRGCVACVQKQAQRSSVSDEAQWRAHVSHAVANLHASTAELRILETTVQSDVDVPIVLTPAVVVSQPMWAEIA
jgi:hypothetical protein